MTDRFNKAVDDIERRTAEMEYDVGEESAFDRGNLYLTKKGNITFTNLGNIL